MARTTHIVAICGSLAEDSATRVSLRVALEAAEGAGADTTLVDLREYDLPPYDSDHHEAGDADRLRRVIGSGDAILLGTPLYHGTFSSALKTALDYCRIDQFEGATVGLLCVAGGDFPTPALSHLRAVARSLHAWTLPLEVAIPNSGRAVADGELDADLADRVRELGTELVAYAGVESAPERAADREQAALAE
ncbi:NADPH-dependent FMN reductase [Halovivax limisalsi]|uniref:NADPH-dependent FMN reductase n=1 Tax=Halovivax limisalsi TaxID=1453760 RepID=UPI001FFD0947|nr:NAD(P)H-dependent oxidoreductase [Halovivax limisalsi]